MARSVHASSLHISISLQCVFVQCFPYQSMLLIVIVIWSVLQSEVQSTRRSGASPTPYLLASSRLNRTTYYPRAPVSPPSGGRGQGGDQRQEPRSPLLRLRHHVLLCRGHQLHHPPAPDRAAWQDDLRGAGACPTAYTHNSIWFRCTPKNIQGLLDILFYWILSIV